MELNDIRREIDRIDDQLVRLFVERMDRVRDAAGAKRRSGRSVRPAIPPSGSSGRPTRRP